MMEEYVFVQGRKTYILKSILSTLPIYFFSLFVNLVSIVHVIEKIQIYFLWERWKENKGMQLVAWKEVVLQRAWVILGLEGSLKLIKLFFPSGFGSFE